MCERSKTQVNVKISGLQQQKRCDGIKNILETLSMIFVILIAQDL